jgi:nucleoid-associated protein YgaU
MRPVTKVVLVLCVVALAVGIIWFAGRKWGGGATQPPARQAQRNGGDRPAYSDPLATYQRWRDRLTGAGQPPADTPRRLPDNLTSSSENEGTAAAHRLDTPVVGADPPGPTLRPSGIEGEVVTGRLRSPDMMAANTYTVVSGDTLYGIAVKHYGDPRCAELIESANPGISARALRIGQRLVLPEKATELKPGEKPAGTQHGTLPGWVPAAKVYVIQKNDTLIGIARRIYGDAAMYRKIYDANKDVLPSPNAALHVGQKLRLPEP